jgi:long-chain acyl-CoA synthetase
MDTPMIVHSLAEIYLMRQKPNAWPSISLAGGNPLQAVEVEQQMEVLRTFGVCYGDRLLMLAEPSTATVAAMVAAWHIGAVVCPLSPNTSPDELRRIAEDCGARHALHAVHSVQTRFEPIRPAAPRFAFRTPPRVTGSDLALIIYTSGSTGAPKGIMLSNMNVLAALRAIAAYLELQSTDLILCVPPLHFDYGLYQVLLGFYTGCGVILTPPAANPLKVLQWIGAFAPTILPIVPALGAGLAQLGKALRQTRESVRLITNTGGHLPRQVIERLREVFRQSRVMPMYGLTESKRALFIAPELVDERPGSVGKPMPGLEAKVFIEGRNDCAVPVYREAAPNETGMLYVRGSSVMQGYTSVDSTAGARLISGEYRDDNWLATGDLFSTDDDGFFYFRGREKDLIKQAGYCLYPREIEGVVEKHDLVIGCVVVGTEDKSGDEIACLFVRTSQEIESEIFMRWLRQRFDMHYLPRRLEFVDDWPLNSNGKVDLAALRRRLLNGGSQHP